MIPEYPSWMWSWNSVEHAFLLHFYGVSGDVYGCWWVKSIAIQIYTCLVNWYHVDCKNKGLFPVDGFNNNSKLTLC